MPLANFQLPAKCKANAAEKITAYFPTPIAPAAAPRARPSFVMCRLVTSAAAEQPAKDPLLTTLKKLQQPALLSTRYYFLHYRTQMQFAYQ